MDEEKAKEIVREFIQATPEWYQELKDEVREGACFVCGTVPDRLLNLKNALELINPLI